MCQLFALNCSAPAAVTFSYAGFSARGGQTGEHADGYGLAFHDGGACRLFIDEGRACDGALSEFLRRHPLRARTVLAHIRKATQGSVQLSNCHPFMRECWGRQWSFCHNGDLKDFHPRLSGAYQPVGDTDSERAFCWMLQTLRARFRGRKPPEWAALAPVMAELAERIRGHGCFNFLLSDGLALYAHASTRLHVVHRAHPFATAHLVDRDQDFDLATANAPGDRMVVVATEPLTRNEAWVAMASGELQVFVGGESVWRHLHPVAPAGVQPRAVQAAGVALALAP
jgi:predicted glutamine amidotransferase